MYFVIFLFGFCFISAPFQSIAHAILLFSILDGKNTLFSWKNQDFFFFSYLWFQLINFERIYFWLFLLFFSSSRCILYLVMRAHLYSVYIFSFIWIELRVKLFTNIWSLVNVFFLINSLKILSTMKYFPKLKLRSTANWPWIITITMLMTNDKPYFVTSK